MREQASASKSAIATDDDQGVNLLIFEGLVGSFASLGSLELLAACGFEDRTSALDDSAHILGRELLNLIVHEAFVATEDGFDADVISDGSAGDSPHGSVHTRGIAT